MGDGTADSPVGNGRREPLLRVIMIGTCLAVVAAVFGFIGSLMLDYRMRSIARVEQQIEKLYGPLHALSLVGKQSKEALDKTRDYLHSFELEAGRKFWFCHMSWRKKPLRPSVADSKGDGKEGFFDRPACLTPDDIERWRRWMKAVFQPNNEKMEQVIVNNAQLIEEPGIMYPVFLTLLLHIESYKATIAKWKDSDSRDNQNFMYPLENHAEISFPEKFNDCVKDLLNGLQERKKYLMDYWNLKHWLHLGYPQISSSNCT